MLIKDLRDGPDGPYILGTMVQRIIGLPPQITNDEDDDSSIMRMPFSYRFHDTSATEETLVQRNGGKHYSSRLTCNGSGRHNNIHMTSTFSVKIPLQLNTEFDRFPCIVLIATADIELTTRNVVAASSPQQKTTLKRLRPNLIFHRQDRWDTISLQRIRNNNKNYHRAGTSITEERLLMEQMDKLSKYQLISPYPRVTYQVQDGLMRSKRFQVSFI